MLYPYFFYSFPQDEAQKNHTPDYNQCYMMFDRLQKIHQVFISSAGAKTVTEVSLPAPKLH